jgi:hypothetical protein
MASSAPVQPADGGGDCRAVCGHQGVGEELMVGDKGRRPNTPHGTRGAKREEVARRRNTRLAEECAKVDPREEQALAEEGIAEDLREWPHY